MSLRILLVSSLLVASCSSSDDDPAPVTTDAPDTVEGDSITADTTPDDPALTFPETFFFGTAIAGFQVDMGCPTMAAEACEDRNSDWYQYIVSPETKDDPGTFIKGDAPTVGPGYWELYDQDHARAADELKNNALRLSIEWSRIFPTATDAATTFEELKALADPDAVAHYHAIFASLKAHGLTPMVTLNHYTLPTWIHDGVGCHVDLKNCSPKGWVDKDRTVTEIAKYAGFVAQEFGGEIDHWVTLNEPFAVLLPGYLLPSEDRTNPPAVFLATDEAKIVLVALIEAHARMYDALKDGDTEDADGDGENSSIGVVYSMVPVIPADPDEELDVQAAKNVFYIYNMVYLNAVALGKLDENLDGNAELRDDLVDRMDYVGVNYYTRITVAGTEGAVLPELSPLSTFDPTTMTVWENYPRGIYEMIKVVNEDLGLPAIITENGTEDTQDDPVAKDTLVRILSWVARAIADGGDVRGYFYWSLIDNYEWNHGMDLRFGLFGVDIEDPTKPRTARPFSAIYAEIAGERRISEALQTAHPVVE